MKEKKLTNKPKTIKEKTLGQKLLEEARNRTTVNLTNKYWGSTLEWGLKSKHYYVRHYWSGFGGMKHEDVRVSAREIAECETQQELELLLKPTNDFAPGDPSGYTPRDIRFVKLTWEPKD